MKTSLLTNLATSFLALLLLSSCVIPRSYPDPKIHGEAPQTVQPLTPKVVSLEVVGQTNGRTGGLVTSAFRRLFQKSFAKIGNLTIGPGGGEVKVVANNVADMGAAAGKGMMSGLTMGIAGVEVTDGYEFTFTYTAGGSAPYTKSYKHALHSIIGATKSPPAGVETMGILKAQAIVIDDVTRSFISDLVRSGKL